MANIELIRQFAGCDPDAEDAVLDACARAAAAWYAAAGVTVRSDDALYDFWVANLAAWMYDMRGAGGDSTQIPAYFLASLHQLRGRNPDAQSGGGD